MQLAGSIHRELHEALLSALPTRIKFEIFARQHLELNLETITSSSNPLEKVAFDLIEWAESTSSISALVRSACEYNPENEILMEFARRHIELLTKGDSARESATFSTATSSAAPLIEACQKVTCDFVQTVIGNRKVISREQFRRQIDDFLVSSSRCGILLGAAGAGKSTAMAIESQRLTENGWTVLPTTVSGNDFSLANLAELIMQQLPEDAPELSWQQIIEPWLTGQVENSSGFMLMIDAIEVAPDQALRQLTLLRDGLSNDAQNRIKIIAASRDFVEGSYLERTPLFNLQDEMTDRSQVFCQRIFRINDFNDEELDQALEAIGTNDLLGSQEAGVDGDIHVAAVRDLIKPPGTFGHYAELLESGGLASTQNLTWSGLVQARLLHSLQQIEERYQIGSGILRRELTALAQLGLQQQSRDFRLDVALVRRTLPHLFTESGDSGHSHYSALLNQGVLSQSSDANGNLFIGFGIRDAGGYLLSFALEEEAEGKNDEELSELVGGWLSNAWNYAPLLDAHLAWIDRLSNEPHGPLLMLLIKTLLEHHRNASMFRLAHPNVIDAIFELIKGGDEHSFYTYREAALVIRSSQEALEIIRHHLTDPNPLARQLAAELVGAHQDDLSIRTLIALLEDGDENVRLKVFRSFGQLGKIAVPFLIEALEVATKPDETRSRYLAALRNIGFRDDRVSVTLENCLATALNGNAELLRSALLTAAHLRDKTQIPYALAALRHEDQDVVHAAAKMLTEAPHAAAFEFLREALPPQFDLGGQMIERYFVPTQVMAALLVANRLAAEPIVTEQLRQGLSGSGELSPAEAVNATKKFEVAAAYPFVLREVVAQLSTPQVRNIIWHATQMLGETWRREPLAALADAANQLSAEGIDIAQTFVRAIAPNMREHDEFPMGDRLNRTKDLLTVIKCQAVNFVTETCRLLEPSSELSAAELCRFLWLVGDDRAEASLIRKLELTMPEGGRGRYARNSIVRALGTCSSSHLGVQAVTAYLTTEPGISLYFHKETLHPLLRKSLLTTEALEGIVRDDQASIGGRIASILAIGETDARGNKELFVNYSSDDENELLQRYAVRMLGFTDDRSVVPSLRYLLTRSARLSIRSQAAEVLGWMEAREALREIERALVDSPSEGSISALARFRERSSLPLLLDGMRSSPLELRRNYLAALGAFSHLSEGKQAIRENFEEMTSGRSDYFDNQGALFDGLIEFDPNWLLEMCQPGPAWGRLSAGGRQEIALSIPFLFKKEDVNKTPLLAVVKRLVCDHDVVIRERALHALAQTDQSFSQQIYEELRSSSSASEWIRACAVQTLGHWDSSPTNIERARYDGEMLVRRAADAALELRRSHNEMQFHIEGLGAEDGLARLSAYLCLKSYGDLSTAGRITEAIPKHTVQRAFVGHLNSAIKERLRNEWRKKQEDEDKLPESRGIIWFD
jgi:HEAT repeat protein